MKWSVKIMRFISPSHEDQRQEFRHAASKAEAFAEEMHRTINKNHDEIAEKLRKVFRAREK